VKSTSELESNEKRIQENFGRRSREKRRFGCFPKASSPLVELFVLTQSHQSQNLLSELLFMKSCLVSSLDQYSSPRVPEASFTRKQTLLNEARRH